MLAAHRTPIRGRLTAVTVETVTFTPAERIGFRLVRGPVPHVTETLTLTDIETGCRLDNDGELGTDFGALGAWWGRIVARTWQNTVNDTVKSVKTEAERQARPPPIGPGNRLTARQPGSADRDRWLGPSAIVMAGSLQQPWHREPCTGHNESGIAHKICFRFEEAMMDVVVLIGRILFVFLFLTAGYAHFAKRSMLAPYAASRAVPSAMLATLAGGVLLIAGGISVLLGIWADLGALLLFIFLVPTAVLMHGFWKETDPQARMTETTQFSKDMALAGAALMLFAFFSYAGDDLGLTVTGPLFSLR